MKDKAVFDYNLKLTQKYCGLKESSKMGDVCSQLRTINSVIKGEQIFEFKLINYYKFGEILEVDWIVDPLYKSNRVKEIYEIQINKKEETLLKGDSFFEGKVLVSKYTDTLFEGACQAASEGFIDEYDLPPIDTWFYLDDDLLYCWIPKMFISYVKEAICVSSTDIYSWLED